MQLTEAIRQQILTPQAIDYVIQKALVEFKQSNKAQDTPQRLVKLGQSIKKLERENDNLVSFIANRNLSAAIADQLRQKEELLADLRLEQNSLSTRIDLDEPIFPDIQAIQQSLYQRINDLRGLLQENIAQSRRAISCLLTER